MRRWCRCIRGIDHGRAGRPTSRADAERIFPEGGVNYVVESHTAPATNQKARTNRSGPSGISPSELGLCAFEGADGLTHSTFEAYRAPYGC
jgi:hypothetical protein